MSERAEILKCSCSHEEQDKLYGKGMRVHNVNTKGEAFCTVCSPSYRRNKNSNAIDANPMFKQMAIPARRPRNPKKVAV